MSESTCIFCQIIRKEAPASIVYEDAQVAAFLSNHPVNIGHTLVVSKKHYSDIYEIPEEEAAHLFKIAKRITRAVKEATGIEAIRIVQNNGKDAGQVVFHFHVHVIPMKPQGQLRLENGFRLRDLLEKDAEKIRQRLNEA
ncbi:MAG TPA: HIT family protein [Candidatus Limnocylindrales bacterium]|nr:HIT family protein [Candidatus Limnocylindrales bacterium]